MIKLIACDMDGTLLDDNSQLPPETLDCINQVEDAGIQFVIATGRRYDTASSFFGAVSERMDFVASNGAQVVSSGRLIDQEVFSGSALRKLRNVVAEFDMLHLSLFDRRQSFLVDDFSCYVGELDKDFPEPRIVGWPSPDVAIIKASVYCDQPDAIMDMAYLLSREVGEKFIFAPSGQHYIDVLQKGVSKVTGVGELLSMYGIGLDEVLAFGDSMNDYELMREAGMSCAVSNARPAIKQIASKVIGSNVEHAVQREMLRIAQEAKA